MNASQARDHVEMIDRILAASEQRIYAGGEFFVVWGAYGAAVTVLMQVIADGLLPQGAIWYEFPALAAAIAYSVIRGYSLSHRAPRMSLIQREFFNVMWLTVSLAFVADAGAFNLFNGWSAAAVWSVAEAIVLFYIGMHGNRRAQIGGIAVVVSMVAANFVAHGLTGYVLAAGMLGGYAGFGLAEMLVRD
jgi:hypothetical protein